MAVAAVPALVFTDWADVVVVLAVSVAVLAVSVAVLTNGVVTLSDGVASLTSLASGFWIGIVNGLILFAGLFEIAFSSSSSSSSLEDSAGLVSTYISNVRYITINLS